MILNATRLLSSHSPTALKRAPSPFLSFSQEILQTMSEEREATITSSNHHNSLKFLELSLRLVATPLCAASLWLTVVNKQTSDSYGNVELSNLSGLR